MVGTGSDRRLTPPPARGPGLNTPSRHPRIARLLFLERGVDLTAPPSAAHEAVLAAPDRCAEAQALGGAAREAGVEALRYRSARDVEGGVNVAALDPRAFGRRRPRDLASWHCTADRTRVEVASRGYFDRTVHVYPRGDFLVHGRLPAPAT